MSRATEILKTALAHIEKPGAWIQGQMYDGTMVLAAKCFCSVGVLHRAIAERDEAATSAADEAFEFFREAVGIPRYEMIFPWNDAPGRTQDEVVAVFRKAVELSEAA